MSEDNPKSGSWLDTLRRSSDSLLGLMQTRIELFAIELQEEKLRTLKLIAWLGVALALGVAGILIVVATLALFLWNSAGYAGLVGLAILVLGSATGVFFWLRRQIQSSASPFAATVAEFKKDRECLQKTD